MPRKKHNDLEMPKPLELISEVKKLWIKYGLGGDIFDTVEKYRNISKQAGYTWDDNCYLPIGLLAQLFTSIPNYNRFQSALINHLSAWRRYKQIYSFDPDFLLELMNTDVSDVPAESFRNLPYDSFYIECDYDNLSGFFVTTDSRVFDTKTDKYVTTHSGIHMYFIYKDGNLAGFPLNTDSSRTVEEIMQENFKLVKSTNAYKPEDVDQLESIIRNTMKCAVQALLYVCSTDCDIQENPAQKSIYKASASNNKDRLAAVRKWDVGYRIGRIIKSHRVKSTEQSTKAYQSSGAGTAKRPHVRRAHFHHFWTGKRNSPDRKLVLRWVSPMFINTNFDEIPATVIKIQ